MRALALFSGGLDSMLAMKLVTMQGIEVIALHVDIGFGTGSGKLEIMRSRAEQTGAKFEVVDVRREYFEEVLFSPKHGYGKHFNPCIDCHGFMFRLAKSLLPKYDAQFLITGEVVGQRPMSQRREAIKVVAKIAEDDELIVRPLCAKVLKPSRPEREGWIDREQLLDISGRGRQRQFALAAEFGFSDYETPGGGCLLTYQSFADKINDLKEHKEVVFEDLKLLKYGRHLRLPNGAKLILGRDEADNFGIDEAKYSHFSSLAMGEIVGPEAILEVNASKEDIELAIAITLSYSRVPKDEESEVGFLEKTYSLKPLQNRDDAKKYFVVK